MTKGQENDKETSYRERKDKGQKTERPKEKGNGLKTKN